MAQKKSKQAASAKPQAKSGKGTNMYWIVGVIAVLVVGGLWAATRSGGSGGAKIASGVPADEAKYLGRLLPASYQEPSVAGVQVYGADVQQTDVAPTQNDTGISIPADKLVADKIVYFEYKKADNTTIPMIAYIKPSGKLFVGVSYCPPCQGKKDHIAAGGTLVCDTCGTVRNLETGVGISGACKLYPLDELPAKLVNGTITVDKAALDGWTAQPLDRKTGA